MQKCKGVISDEIMDYFSWIVNGIGDTKIEDNRLVLDAESIKMITTSDEWRLYQMYINSTKSTNNPTDSNKSYEKKKPYIFNYKNWDICMITVRNGALYISNNHFNDAKENIIRFYIWILRRK